MPTLYVIREGYSIDDIDSDRVVAEGDILAIRTDLTAAQSFAAEVAAKTATQYAKEYSTATKVVPSDTNMLFWVVDADIDTCVETVSIVPVTDVS